MPSLPFFFSGRYHFRLQLLVSSLSLFLLSASNGPAMCSHAIPRPLTARTSGPPPACGWFVRIPRTPPAYGLGQSSFIKEEEEVKKVPRREQLAAFILRRATFLQYTLNFIIIPSTYYHHQLNIIDLHIREVHTCFIILKKMRVKTKC